MSDSEDFGEVVRRARAASYAAGLAEGRRLAAEEMAARLRQMAVDVVIQGYGRGALLGNATGPGSLAALGDGR
jgi:hypothetical protein